MTEEIQPWREGDRVFWGAGEDIKEGAVEADEIAGKNLRVKMDNGRVIEHNPRLVRAEP